MFTVFSNYKKIKVENDTNILLNCEPYCIITIEANKTIKLYIFKVKNLSFNFLQSKQVAQVKGCSREVEKVAEYLVWNSLIKNTVLDEEAVSNFVLINSRIYLPKTKTIVASATAPQNKSGININF